MICEFVLFFQVWRLCSINEKQLKLFSNINITKVVITIMDTKRIPALDNGFIKFQC